MGFIPAKHPALARGQTLRPLNVRRLFAIEQLEASSVVRQRLRVVVYCEQRRLLQAVTFVELTSVATLKARDIVARIEGTRSESWRERLWLLMTVAGVVLLVCAALAV